MSNFTILEPITVTADMIESTNVSDALKLLCFDSSTSTQSTNTGTISYRVDPGQLVNGVALLNCIADTARVRVVDDVEGTVYDSTEDMSGVIPEASWWSYFFAETVPRTTAVFLDLPTYGSADVLIDLDAGTKTAAVGVIVIGRQQVLPITVQYGVEIRAIDYSRKETDEFGDVVFIKRNNSRLITLPCIIPTGQIDMILDILADKGLTLWIADQEISQLIVYGWYQDLSVLVSYPKISDCNIELQRLI